MGKPLECETGHHIECPCLFSFKHQRNREQYFKIMERWKTLTIRVAERKEFNNRDDFTVVVQPFLGNVTMPTTTSGKTDFTYLSMDCFHLSQKGYARGIMLLIQKLNLNIKLSLYFIASNALWNNMIEPVGNKSTNWRKEFTLIKCPTENHPYLATRQNS